MSNSEPKSEDILQRFVRYSQDPWAFLTECIFTLDQVDTDNPIKLYPKDMDYLYLFVRLWQREKLIAVPKSRRMTMSWTCLALNLWFALFGKGRHIALVSKKEDDASELLQRVEFMYRNIPEDRIPKDLLPKIKGGKATKSPPVLEFEDTSSVIRGTAMGADQLRQFTFSSIFGDECAFWPEAEKFYAAAKPTLDGGGRMTLVSSRSPGFFKKIVFDQIDNPTYNFPEIAPSEIKNPMQGVELWKNPKNRFLVFDLHYTANPAKRGDAWRESVKQSMPARDFAMEYEKSWHTFEGLPVYADFIKDVHVTRKEINPVVGLPLILGHDFGMNSACVVTQLVGNQLRVIKEFIGQNEGTMTFIPKVMRWIKQKWPGFYDDEKHFVHAIDPAGLNRNPNDSTTCAWNMRTYGNCKVIKPGPTTFEPRKNAIEKFLLHIDRDGPGLLVSEKGCPVIVEGFAGGYRYPDKAADIEPGQLRPLKDNYSHPHDALQYAAFIARASTQQKSVNIPAPQYHFGLGTQSLGESAKADLPQHRRKELGKII